MQKWAGKVAIVTGVSSGIGAAVAEKLVENGLQVLGLARRTARVKALSTKVMGPGKLHPMTCDVTIEDDILNSFKWAEENLGPVNILVNNAGYMTPSLICEADTKVFNQVIDTNLLGVCIASREAMKQFVKHKIDGHIVHINSVGGHRVAFARNPYYNVYHATKHGVTALTETMRQEFLYLKSKAKVSSISPGLVYTEMVEHMAANADWLATKKDDLPYLNPEDVADAVIFILGTPPHVQVQDILMNPIGQTFF